MNTLIRTRGWPWNQEKLILTSDVEFEWRAPPTNEYSTSEIFISSAGKMQVFAGFIWDGATAVPSGKYLQDWSSLPVDTLTNNPVPSQWKATLRHDAAYQNMSKLDDFGRRFPFTREEIDDHFYTDLVENNFKLAKLYFIGVALFGGVWHEGAKLFRKLGALFKRE